MSSTPIKIEKSICGKFIRVSFHNVAKVVTISDWSKAISSFAEFFISPAEKLRVENLDKK